MLHFSVVAKGTTQKKPLMRITTAELSFSSSLPVSRSYSDEDYSSSSNLQDIRQQTEERARAAIPRTSGVEHQIEANQPDEPEEICHNPFPPSQFADKEFCAAFLSREPTHPPPLFVPPETESATIEQSNILGETVDEYIIHMLDINELVDKARSSEKYLVTWCDLKKGVDAKKPIEDFFMKKCNEIDKSMCVRPKLSWVNPGPTFNSRNLVRARPVVSTIFHYIGLGMPPPESEAIWMAEPAGECWRRMKDLAKVVAAPGLMIFDCDHARVLSDWFVRQWDSAKPCFMAMFACLATENLNIPSHLPHDLFTCILLSPEKAYSAITGAPDTSSDDFQKILDLFTESIAQDVLPMNTYYLLFQRNPCIGAFWRRFLLAQRLLKQFGIHAKSVPELPDMSEHCLWEPFSYSIIRLGECRNCNVVIDRLCELYVSHFEKVRKPSKAICAMIAAMLQIDSKRQMLMGKIADFMVRSPQNCYDIGCLISVNWVRHCVINAIDSEFLRNWCIVISGVVLAVPSLAGRLEPAVRLVSEQSPGDEIANVYFLSISVALRDCQSHIACSLDTQTIIDHIPLIVSSTPLARQWFAILIHAYISLYQTEPRATGATGLHVVAMFLLYEDRIYTRAAGVAIMTALLAPNCPEFSETLVRCAMKAAFDGSAVVRLTFVHLVALYAINNKDTLEYEVDNFLEKVKIPDDKHCLDNSDNEKLPLRQILLALKCDPCATIRETVEAILNNPCNPEMKDVYYSRIHSLHRLAHRALFSQEASMETLEQRYPDTLFTISELEWLETLKGHNSPVTFVSFDADHGNVCSGHADGTVCWANNKWHIEDSPVTSITELPHHVIAVGHQSGNIHLLRNKTKCVIDSFRPSLEDGGKDIVMVTVPGTGLTFISHGTPSIAVWNLESLLLVRHIKTEAIPEHFVIIRDQLYCSLSNGTILQFNIDTYELTGQNAFNQQILRMGERFGKLYTVLRNGAIYIWDSINEPQFRRAGSEQVVDLALHRVLKHGVIIAANKPRLITSYDSSGLDIDSITTATPRCCCFDDAHPLCAIGYDDGSVAVWRIPS